MYVLTDVITVHFTIKLSAIYYFLIDIDDCVNHTCANGGSCVDGYNNYSCNCLPGYTGERCETGMLALRL